MPCKRRRRARARPRRAAADAWRGFDAFVAQNVQTMRDAGNLYATIAFMQRIEGEKHLVFVTERGFQLPRWDDERDLARVAADSRVAIDVLQTGGLVGPAHGRPRFARCRRCRAGWRRSRSTAGSASRRLDEATTSSYLLGYYPTNSKWDGAFRSISVKVNRPGVTLAYRRGYNARVVSPVFDRLEYVTRFRMEGALDYRDDVKDIGVTLDARRSPGSSKQTFVDVKAQIDPAALHFEVRDGVSFGRVTIAVVPMDSQPCRHRRQVQAAGGVPGVRPRRRWRWSGRSASPTTRGCRCRPRRGSSA